MQIIAFSTFYSPQASPYAAGGTRWPERSVAFHRWGSATNTKSIELLGGEKGVHLILANPSWRDLQQRAQKIQGDKKHVDASAGPPSPISVIAAPSSKRKHEDNNQQN
jgi:hypothetical protein